MTFIPTLDDSKQRPRVPRTLDPVEVRVLGSLMEKQLSTPEYYPLTLNALSAAASQKSNREPVMDLGDSDLQRALDRLQDEKLVWKVFGGRAVRYDHNLDSMWQIDRAAKAILTLLFLRGPQTAGEIRGRSERLHAFESVAEAEEALQRLSTQQPPMVRELPRRPGQKESRWAHLLGGAIVEPAMSVAAEGETSHDAREPLSVRVQRLEEQLAALTAEFHSLRAKLGE
jgi:uncharacterized protein YceH (UPF0502 family)